MKQISVQETVMFYDTDCGGVVSNIAYLRYVEKARSILFGEMGVTVQEMTDTQLFPVVVRTEIDYRIPAKLGDEIEIRARLDEVQKVRTLCSFSLIRTAEEGKEQLIAQAKQVVALVQMPSGRPQRTPESWKNFI